MTRAPILILMAAVAASACGGEDYFVHQVDFNPTLTSTITAAGGLTDGTPNPALVSAKFVTGGAPSGLLVSDAYPIIPAVGAQSPFDTNDIPRSTCYWTAIGHQVEMSWEIYLNGSVGTHVAQQDIGTCTLSNPFTRNPILMTDGDQYEIEEEEWEEFVADNQLLTSATLRQCQDNAMARQDLCVANTACDAGMLVSGFHARDPMCMPQLRVPLAAVPAGVSESQRHGDTTFVAEVSGSVNGDAMPMAAHTFATTFKGVPTTGRTLRRPLTRREVVGRNGETIIYRDWETPVLPGGSWEENFSPRIHLESIELIDVTDGGEVAVPMRRVRVFEADLGPGASGQTVCQAPAPGELAFNSGAGSCPLLAGYNPTMDIGAPQADVHRRRGWEIWAPDAPDGRLYEVRFRVIFTGAALVVDPGEMTFEKAFPKLHQHIEEALRAMNNTDGALRLNIDFDERGWLRPQIPDDGVLVPPGATTAITIGVEPDEEGRRTETLTVTLTDSSGKQVHRQGIPVHISALQPRYTVTPDDAAGPVTFDASTPRRTFTVENVGSGPVEILYLAATGSADFTVGAAPVLPLTLAPGQTTTFDVEFRTSSSFMAYGAVSVITDFDVTNIALTGAP